MSANAPAPRQQPAATMHEGDVVGHGSLRDYLTGFVLSAILTAIPFWLVMGDVIGNAVATAVFVIVLAIAQIVVHMVYFLHLNSKAEGGWNMLALIFTVILVFIALTGSLWVMHHLDVNMMPGMMQMSRM